MHDGDGLEITTEREISKGCVAQECTVICGNRTKDFDYPLGFSELFIVPNIVHAEGVNGSNAQRWNSSPSLFPAPFTIFPFHVFTITLPLLFLSFPGDFLPPPVPPPHSQQAPLPLPQRNVHLPLPLAICRKVVQPLSPLDSPSHQPQINRPRIAQYLIIHR